MLMLLALLLYWSHGRPTGEAVTRVKRRSSGELCKASAVVMAIRNKPALCASADGLLNAPAVYYPIVPV